MVTVVPTPRSLWTSIVPPFNSTLRFAIVRPEPGAGGLGREVGLEEPSQRLLIHAHAGVGNLDDHRLDPAAGRCPSVRRRLTIVKRPLAGHRVQRVLDDVGQRAREQRAIDRSAAADRPAP